MYPGAQASQDQGRVRSIYGVPMTPGLKAADAASLFLQQHARAFGAGDLDLRLFSSADTQSGRHSVFAFQQYIDGMRVEHGQVRVLVLRGAANRVIFAGSTVSPRPAGGAFAPMTVDADGAVQLVKGFKQYSKLPVYSKPELVVYQGDGSWTEPVRAWKFVAEQPDPNRRERWTFFVDAAANSLIRVRNEVLHADLTGSVQGKATPGLYPDVATNAPTLQPMAFMRVVGRQLGGVHGHQWRVCVPQRRYHSAAGFGPSRPRPGRWHVGVGR
jgi:Zn-dependent metalloprotease